MVGLFAVLCLTFQGARALAAVETEDAAFVLRQLLRRFLDEGFHIAAKVSVTRALSLLTLAETETRWVSFRKRVAPEI